MTRWRDLFGAFIKKPAPRPAAPSEGWEPRDADWRDGHPICERQRAGMRARGPLGALMLACFDDDLAGAQRALLAGAPVDGEDGYGERALRLAARSGSTQIVELLLDQGADIHAPGMDGACALMRAIQAHSLGAMRLLLARGANPEARVGCAADALPAHGESFLTDFGPDPWGPYFHRFWGASERQSGDTALMQAVIHDGGSAKACVMLLEFGAEPNRANRLGVTPLMLAAHRGELIPLMALLDAGANPSTRDALGRSAAHIGGQAFPLRPDIIDKLKGAEARKEAGLIASELREWNAESEPQPLSSPVRL